MEDTLDALLADEPPPEEAQERLQAALSSDPELADASRRWQVVQAALRGELAAHVPERRLLVLHALEADEPALLSAEEQAELEAARPALRRARAAHPALADVMKDIRRARVEFEAAWVEHAPGTPDEAHAPSRMDRPPRSRPRPVRHGAWRLAAGSALVLLAVVLLFLLKRHQSRVTVTVADGERQRIELAEGASARVTGPARLVYVDPEAGSLFDGPVRLEAGRAFFVVQPAPNGFVVETPAARAVVLGTRFGVQVEGGVTEVVLAAGELALAPREAPDQLVVLAPGQRSRVAEGALPTTPTEVNLTEALAWSGLLIFRNTPIEDAAARLSRRYGVSVRVARALRGEQVTGTFDREQPPPEVLRVLAAALGAELRRQEDAHLLAPVV